MMTNDSIAEITAAEQSGSPTQNSGTIAGIILGCVALLAVVSAISALCYWWKSSGPAVLPTFPGKCYTISTGRHAPSTCVPGQTNVGRGTEDSTFMLNYMAHSYGDPLQDNFDVDVDNDYFLSSLESSIHFSRQSSSGCLQKSVVNPMHPSEAYFKPKPPSTGPRAFAANDNDREGSRPAFDPVPSFIPYRTSREEDRKLGAHVDGGASLATTVFDERGGTDRPGGIQAGIAVLPRRLENCALPVRDLERQLSHEPYMLDRGQSLITTYHSERRKTETLPAKSANVFQYPPPMTPISLLLRK